MSGRSDVYCIEILTGRMAFGGATLSDTLAGVIERDPSWEALPPSTPPAIYKLLRRCLTKPVGRRLRDIGDALLDLESASAVDESVPAVAPATARKSLRARSALTVTAAALAAAVVVVASRPWWGGIRDAAPALESMTRLTSDAGLTIEPSISADGRVIAYASNRSGDGNLDVYVQQISGGAAIRLTTDTADDRTPTVSPDGGVVAFRSDRNPPGIYVVPRSAETPVSSDRMVAGRASLQTADPLPIGRDPGWPLAVWRLPAKCTSSPPPEEHPCAWRRICSALAIRCGHRMAKACWCSAVMRKARMRTGGACLSLEARRPGPGLPSTGCAPARCHHDGHLPLPEAWYERGVLFSAADDIGDTRALWRIAIDMHSGQPSGEPIRLTRGTTVDVWPSVSNTNRVAFAAQTVSQNIFGLPIDADAGKVTGTMRRLRDDSARTGRPSLSEDGRLMVFPKYEFASGGVWARDLTTGREWQLAATPRTPLNPVITVDGRWTAYTVTKVDQGGNDGPGDGFVVETTSGVPRQVCSACQLDNGLVTDALSSSPKTTAAASTGSIW